MSEWPWKSLLPIHHAFDVCDFLEPLEVVELRHELVENLKVIVAAEGVRERCVNNAIC
jgi:hypothetical protein